MMDEENEENGGYYTIVGEVLTCAVTGKTCHVSLQWD